MKKFLSLIAAACMALSAASLTSFAESEPLDFDGNGVVDPIDSMIILQYYTDVSMGRASDWDGKAASFSFNEDYTGSFIKNYDTNYNDFGQLVVKIELSNEILEKVRQNGDVDGNGYVDALDAADMLESYYSAFKKGDVNMDGVVNSMDASCVLSYYTGISVGEKIDNVTATAMDIIGNVNGDSLTDAADASAILQMYAEAAIS